MAPTIEAPPRVLAVVGLLLTACTAGGSAPEDVGPCEAMSTGGPIAATSGGDHGPPWEPPPPPGLDDTMMEKLDIWGPEYDLSGPPPVVDWHRDPITDLHYRKPTENEVVANKWDGNVLLVALPDTLLRNLRAGVSPIVFQLPLADAAPWSDQTDLPVLEVDLVVRASRSSIGVVQHRVVSTRTVVTSTSRPTFHTYLQAGLAWGDVDDSAVRLTARDHGGIAVVGATYGRHFWLEGPYEDRTNVVEIDILPDRGRKVYVLHTVHGALLSSGLELSEDDVATSIQNATLDTRVSTLAAAPDVPGNHIAGIVHQCTDELNNDPQLGPYDADGCDFSCMSHPDFGTDAFPGIFPVLEYGKPFAIVGDAEWCTRHVGDGVEDSDWAELLVTIGETAETMLNQVEAPALEEFPGPRVPPFRLVGVHCFFFPTVQDATDCHFDGDCPGAFADYPFKNVGRNYGCRGDTLGECPDPENTTTYLHRVWDAADLWAADAMAVNGFDAAHPIQHIAVLTPYAYLYEPFDEIVGGKAFLPVDDLHLKYAGGAVVRSHIEDTELSPIGTGRRMAHEFGHTYGLAHDDDTFYEGDPNLRSFMHFEGGPAPILGVDTPAAVPGKTQYQVWTQSAPLKWVPRPPGFKWVGCDLKDPGSCPPGLSCVEIGENGNSGTACREIP